MSQRNNSPLTLSAKHLLLILIVMTLGIFNTILPKCYATNGTAKVLIFYAEGCEHCAYVMNEFIPSIESKFGASIEFRYLDVDSIENYKFLVSLEERLSNTGNEFPVAIIGQKILGGKEEVINELEVSITKCIEAGGCDWPQEERVPAKQEIKPISEVEAKHEEAEKICVTYLYTPRCKKCDRAGYMLKALKADYENVITKELDISQRHNKELAEAICKVCEVPEEKRLVSPTIFIGREYLVSGEISELAICKIIAKYENTGTVCVWETAERLVSEARKGIIERFKSLGLTTIVSAGLLDGVNPCAFTTIIFFISYLAFVGRKRREIVIIGAAFTFAVFLTYFLIGIGALKFIERMGFLSIVAKIIYGLTGTFAIVLAVLSFSDWYKHRKGKTSDMTLQLPSILKKRIHTTIREESRVRSIALGAFITGAIVSILELACTGQVYLPTIVFVTGVPSLRMNAIAYLFLYNVMFILPLVAIFLASYWGITSEQLTSVMRKNLGVVKILLGFLFLGLGIFLIYYVLL
jgi:glutaredoxin